MPTTGTAAIIAAIVATATIGTAAFVSYQREKFERERIQRADDERYERERRFGGYLPPVQQQMYLPMIPMQQRQLDVRWTGYNDQPQLCYDTPAFQNCTYIDPNTEFTFENNDSMLRAIASRPPIPSPIYGYRTR